MRTVIAALLISVATCTAANASEFDGWTLEQLKAHPDFVSLELNDYARSSLQHESNLADAELTHDWIGYVLLSGDREYPQDVVLVDALGQQVTCEYRWTSI